MPQRPVGVSDVADAPNVAPYRVRERTVGGVTVAEQRVIEGEKWVRAATRAMSSYRMLGRAATTQNLWMLWNNTSERHAGLRRLTVQMDATASLSAVAPLARLYRVPVPADITGLAGVLAPERNFDTTRQEVKGGVAGYQQRCRDLGARALWPFDEASGLPQDIIGTHHFTAQAGTPPTLGNPDGPHEVQRCLRINAAALGNFSTPHSALLNPTTGTSGGFTYSFFARVISFANAASNTSLFAKHDNPLAAIGNTPWGMHIQSGVATNMRLSHIRTNAGGTTNDSLPQSRHAGHWMLITVTRNPSNTTDARHRVFVDGANDNTTTAALTLEPNTNTNPFYVGALGNANAGLVIELSNLAFWNRSLTNAEITSLHQATNPKIELRTDGGGLDGYNGAGAAFDALGPFTISAGSQMVAQLPMRIAGSSPTEQIRMEDAVLLGSSGEPIIARQNEMLVVRLEATATTSNPATNHYIINAVVDEYEPV